VYGVSTLIFRGPALLKDPVGVAVAFARNVLQSSVFLTCYCAASWVGADAGEALLGKGQAKFLLAGAFGGSAVLLERKSRRAELALYVATHAAKIVYRAAVQWRLVPPMPSPLGETLGFSLALAVILHAYVKRPELLRKTYYGLFKFFFGTGGKTAGFGRRDPDGRRRNGTVSKNASSENIAEKVLTTAASSGSDDEGSDSSDEGSYRKGRDPLQWESPKADTASAR
jgi:hypothetical protein